jgi:O-antigen ligase
MRRVLLAVTVLALVGGPTALAFFSGGYFDRPRLIAALVAWALLIVAALTSPHPLPRTTAGRIALGALALFCAWTALSVTWAPIPGRAEEDLQRLLLYLAFFAAAVACIRGPATRAWLEPGIVLGIFVVVAYGLSERLLPGVVELSRSASADGRLEQPITYWNAYGIVAALGMVLAVHVAGDPDRARWLRSACAAAAVPLGLGLYLTFARGALGALVLGLLVLLALAPAGREQLRAAVVAVAATAVACVVANSLPTVHSLQRGETGDPTDGLIMFAALVALALAAALIAPRAARRPLPMPRLPVSRALAVLSVAAVVMVSAIAAVAALEGKPENVSPARGANPARLASIDTNRYSYWGVALRSFGDQPLRGIGSGGFYVEWLKERDRVDRSGDAHSLYLETAAELGIVGVALLALFLGGVIASVVRLYRLNPRAATGLAGGITAWAFHAGLDWDWEMPAATLPALLLAAAAVAWYDEYSRRPATPADTSVTGAREASLQLDGHGVPARWGAPSASSELPSGGS